MQLPQQRRTLRSKILSHIISVQSHSDGVSQHVKISIHQFYNCLSQVKIDVTTVNNGWFLPYWRSLASFSSFSRTVPRRTEHVRQSPFLPVTSPNV